MERETQEIQCPKCQTKMRIHVHLMATVHDGHMSQVTLLPSWSTDERICPGCGSMIAPIIMEIKHGYTAYDPPKEQPRIIPASIPIPRNLKLAGER
jgi:hypothetical protein